MQRIDIRGTMLNLKAVGNGPPLVLVHGLGGDHRSWEFVEPHLSERFRVIMPDLRCHGSSDCPEGMSMPSDYAADIAGLMSHLSIERAPVVGISMGGMVLLQMLLDFPRHVSAAVLVSTTPCVTEQLIDVVYSWREAQLQGGDEAYWWASTRDAFTESFIEDNPDLMDRLKRRFLEDARRFDVSSVLGFSSFDVVDRLGEISVPVLIVHGSKDRIMDPAMARMMNERIRGSRLVILEDCGHSPDVEQHERLARLIADFILSVGQEGTGSDRPRE